MQNEKLGVQERGTVRAYVDQFKIHDHRAAQAAIDGLTAAGFDVDVKPGFVLCGPLAEPAPCGDILTVYRKEG